MFGYNHTNTMVIWILRIILYLILFFSIIAFAVLIRSWRTMDQKEAMNQLLNFIPAIGSIVVGFVTVEVLNRQSSYQNLEHQPTFVVNYVFNGIGDTINTNQEYSITNVGERTKTLADIDVSSFLVVHIQDTSAKEKEDVRYFKVQFFGQGVSTNQLTGHIYHSQLSGDNVSAFDELIHQTVSIEKDHPDMLIDLERIDLFKIVYQDMYGVNNTIYRDCYGEYDKHYYDQLCRRAKESGGDIARSIFDLNLPDLLTL